MERRLYVMSDASDDLMFESRNLCEARKSIQEMLTQPEMLRYFPISIQVDSPRSPYRRKMRVLEIHTVQSTTVYRVPAYVKENGEIKIDSNKFMTL